MDVDVEYVELPDLPDPLTRYYFVDGDWGWEGPWTAVYAAGYPCAGLTDAPFLELPELVVPATLRTHHPLHDAIRWHVLDAEAYPYVTVIRDGERVWDVVGGRGADSLVIPALPSPVDPVALLGPGLVQGLLGFADWSDVGEVIGRESRSDRFILEP